MISQASVHNEQQCMPVVHAVSTSVCPLKVFLSSPQQTGIRSSTYLLNHIQGDGSVIAGLEEVLVGMSPGGKVRAFIPPSLAYDGASKSLLAPQPPTFATQRQLLNHSKEPLVFEVELLRIR
jgi:FKBP-type peptidyl-prolyl cis-trans isomerase